MLSKYNTMKIPKLKYYYLALNPKNYERFETTRQLLINEPSEINIATGQVSRPIPFHYLYSQPTVADTRYRQLNHHLGPVYVLRIPAAIVPRKTLEPTEDPRGMWLCRANLAIESCAVECFELDPTEPEVKYEVIARSRRPREKNHNNLA